MRAEDRGVQSSSLISGESASSSRREMLRDVAVQHPLTWLAVSSRIFTTIPAGQHGVFPTRSDLECR